MFLRIEGVMDFRLLFCFVFVQCLFKRVSNYVRQSTQYHSPFIATIPPNYLSPLSSASAANLQSSNHKSGENSCESEIDLASGTAGTRNTSRASGAGNRLGSTSRDGSGTICAVVTASRHGSGAVSVAVAARASGVHRDQSRGSSAGRLRG